MSVDPSMQEAPGLAGASRSTPRVAPRRFGRLVLAGALLLWTGTSCWHANKPLPEGLRVAAPWQALAPEDVRFIADVTAADAYGRPVVSQAIFDEMLATIGRAREFVVADFFLFNEHRGAQADSARAVRPLARELRNALIARKAALPRLQVLFITDPINETYGAEASAHLEALRGAGIKVVTTDLDRLRDSNPAYSGLWRLALVWWLDAINAAVLPHPFDIGGERVSPAAWARLANFKANHRKVLLADDGAGGVTGLVSSANPHDASSAHSNVALQLTGAALEPLIASELAIAHFSGVPQAVRRGVAPTTNARTPAPASRELETASVAGIGSGRVVAARALTEGAIRDAILERIAGAGRTESIDMAMFYLAERRIVEALLAASARGAAIRLILDPNKDAFGRTKSGMPNRQVATELVSRSDRTIRVRWYRTHGEQFHAKLVLVRSPGRLWLTAGSANLTRRNLADFNLEANFAVEAADDSPLASQALAWFETLWTNRAPLGIEYTADFEVYADPSQLRYWQYRFMEATGLSTF